MEIDDGKAVNTPLKKSSQKENDQFIRAFRCFENANMRNRDTFSELLNYTMENRRD